MDKLEKIKICIDYGEINYTDLSVKDLNFIEMDGWLSSTVGTTDFDDLPTAAKEYIRTIEKLAHVPIVLISTGPSRDQIIIQKIFCIIMPKDKIYIYGIHTCLSQIKNNPENINKIYLKKSSLNKTLKTSLI